MVASTDKPYIRISLYDGFSNMLNEEEMKMWAGLLVVLAVGLFLMIVNRLDLNNLIMVVIYVLCCPAMYWGCYLFFNGTTIEEDNKTKKDK